MGSGQADFRIRRKRVSKEEFYGHPKPKPNYEQGLTDYLP